MKLYCNRAERTDSHGVVRDGPPLRSLGAVEIFRRCPKFCGIDEPFPFKNHERQQVINAEDDNDLYADRSRKILPSLSKKKESNV